MILKAFQMKAEKKFINIKMNNKKSIDLKFYTMVENFDDI